AGKYLVAPGILTLGLIRFFHALIPGPRVPLLWHPLFLLNHVTILSAVAYKWEEKRPTLTRTHWVVVLGGLGLIDFMAVFILAIHRGRGDPLEALAVQRSLEFGPRLLVPLAAAAAFVLLGWYVRRRSASSPEAGQTLMLY